MNCRLIILFGLVAVALSSFACGVCQTSVRTTSKFVKLIIPKFLAVEALDALCMRRYYSQKLCKRVGQQIAPIAINNFIQKHISSDRQCSSLCNDSYVKYEPDQQVRRILSGQPLKPINLNKFLSFEQFEISQKKQLKVLHLSDIHQDKNYVEKSSVSCQLPICCHADNGFPQNPSAQAKKYGSKNCDSPSQLLDSFLEFVRNQPDVDIVLATGDFAAHNQWEKTPESIAQTEKQIKQKIIASFPKSILIKSEGNNDYAPDHQYDAAKDPKLIKITSVKSGSTTLTFASLNTMAFDEMNLYLLGDQSFAIFQLMLLEQILQKYENVYLLGHIPPTIDGTVVEYSKVFRALVAKYSSKIKNQFYGHLHSDQLNINTYPGTETGTGFCFIAPSISPLHVGLSRSRIYRLAIGDKNGVSDFTQYHIKDLSSQKAQWLIQYSFRQKYNLGDQQVPITLKQIQQIKKNIFDSKTEQNKYLRTTGLQPQFGAKSYCNFIDDSEKRKSCVNRSISINDKIYKILDILRGKWGYKTKLLKQ